MVMLVEPPCVPLPTMLTPDTLPCSWFSMFGANVVLSSSLRQLLLRRAERALLLRSGRAR